MRDSFDFKIEGPAFTMSKSYWIVIEKAIREEARLRNLSLPFPSKNMVFAVDVSFYFTLEGIFPLGKRDLDNLTKPILDTIFNCRKKGVTAVLFELDDTYVRELHLQKKMVATKDDQCTMVSIKWREMS